MVMNQDIEDQILEMASSLEFGHESTKETGYFFQHKKNNICLIIDTTICNLENYAYVDYTSCQNQLFHEHEIVLRFLHDETSTTDELESEIKYFLQGGEDIEKISRFGRNRTEQDIDPTRPEAAFEDHFIEAFGETMRGALHREFKYADCAGMIRYVDYMLITEKQKFAIEVNGETYHHPRSIGPKRYRSQLFKQNSLSVDGFKVFRWSQNGMRDSDNFIQEIQTFFGDSTNFQKKSHFKVDRNIKVLKLHEHQQDALKFLTAKRAEGRNTFLVVLPTGTGKTEIFIKDIEKLKKKSPNLKAIIFVPTKELRRQTVERLKSTIPLHVNNIGTGLTEDNPPDIIVQTYAFMHRHYFKFDKDQFDYIVVDEAHHAIASGLRSILEYYTPKHLLGVTATPDRFDQQKLEEVFGEYESPLSLEEAIKKRLVPPVRCYRIKSNIDLSEVRFNGKDYVKSDLQITLRVPSRDELVAETLVKNFSGDLAHKQGVIFCVDINHAKRMAACLNKAGLSALAVNGRERKSADEAIGKYNDTKVRFLCACDLLTEGWDAPHTSILVMARPTFSKVLYTQQLGRGLRIYPNKEALYVLDVVDNYGAKLQPMSLHAFFGINTYRPFDFLVKPETVETATEIKILEGIYEGIRRIEPVNIHNFENLYGDFLNEEQLARELFVSTGTIKSWLKKGKINADYKHPFGRSTLHFFNPSQVNTIRLTLGLSKHTAETRKEDFLEFLEKGDYTFSYKIIFLLAFLKIQNKLGQAELPVLLSNYQMFYQRLLAKHGRNEKQNCPYNNSEYMDDGPTLQRNLLQNPFEKFERKRFFRHCKDLNYIALDSILGKQLTIQDHKRIESLMIRDLRDYYAKQDIEIEETDYAFLFIDDEKVQTPSKPNFIDYPAEEDKYKSVLPLFPLQVAAGYFYQSEMSIEPDTWLDMRDLSTRRAFDESMFVAKIQGKSMEPGILDGSYCLFTKNVGGTRNGRIVLARKSDIVDQDTGASFTIKKYYSSKISNVKTGWRHDSIILKPANPDYQDIHIPSDNAGDFAVVAFFIEVLEKR